MTVGTTNVVRVLVPAKVNLQLAVGPPRPDGYHELVNVFHALSLFDEVRAEPADEIEAMTTGTGAQYVPDGAGNLAVRAARLLADKRGVRAGALLHIDKAIPVAGGMAGGSADAAAALVACDALWRTGASRGELLDLAVELGSDVPFALLGGTAVGRGRGEDLTEVPAGGSFTWVLATANAGLSTPAVYAACDRLRGAAPVPPPAADTALLAALRDGDPVRLGARLSNDLQPAALRLRPALRGTLDTGLAAGALGGLVSGSGPTCAFLADGTAGADRIAAALRAAGVCDTPIRAQGPAPGARVVSG